MTLSKPAADVTGADVTGADMTGADMTGAVPSTTAADGRTPRPAATRRLRDVLCHEWFLAVTGGLLIAAVLTWPTLRHPLTTVPGDIGDPTLQAWQVAWDGHALLTDPAHLWDSNTFFPATYTLAYSDTLLGYSVFGMVGSGMTAAVLRYNILYVLLFAMAFTGAYALVRQLGANRIGGAVAGIAWSFGPWRLGHAGHMNILSIGGIALSLAMLARGHGWSLRHGHRPQLHKPGWVWAGWLLAAWQISLGFGVGLPLVYFLLGACAVAACGYLWSWWRRGRPQFGRQLLIADLAGGALFGAVTVLLGRVFLHVVELNPQARRDLAWTAQFSPPLRGYLVAPEYSWAWGDLHAAARQQLGWWPEMALLPGVTLIVLAAVGLVHSAFSVRHRILLGLGLFGVGALGLGTKFANGGEPGYITLSKLLPGWDALRTPGRMMVWISLLLAILAAGAITAFAADLAGRADRPMPRALRLLLLIPLVMVFVEGINKTPHPEVPQPPAAMQAAPEPILVLPSDGLLELHVGLWSTNGWPRVANGLASFMPTDQEAIRGITGDFPDQTSVAYLRQMGIHSVVVLRDRLNGTPWAGVLDRPVDGLGITRVQVGPDVVFRLD